PPVLAVKSDANRRPREPSNDAALQPATEVQRHLVACGAELAEEGCHATDTAWPLEDVQPVEPGMPLQDRRRGRLDGPAEGRGGCPAAQAAKERKSPDDVAERAGKNDQHAQLAWPFRP